MTFAWKKGKVHISCFPDRKNDWGPLYIKKNEKIHEAARGCGRNMYGRIRVTEIHTHTHKKKTCAQMGESSP